MRTKSAIADFYGSSEYMHTFCLQQCNGRFWGKNAWTNIAGVCSTSLRVI